MSSDGRITQQIRELQRQKRFNGRALPTNLVGGVDIPYDAFDYTDIPRRMGFNASKKSDVIERTAQNYVKNNTPYMKFPYRRFRFAYSEIKNDLQVLTEGPGSCCEYRNNEFLIEETLSGFDLWESVHAIRQLKKLLEGPEDRDFIMEELNFLPDNDSTYKMRLDKEVPFCCRITTHHLKCHGWRTFKQAMADLNLAREKYEVYKVKFAYARRNPNVGDPSRTLNPEEAGEYSWIMKKRKSCVLVALASIFVGNADVIGTTVHFPGVKNTEQLDFLVSAISQGSIKSCEVDDVIESIHGVVLPWTFHQGQTNFLLIKSHITRENYMWVKILYKPTPRARELFKYGFLHPSDEIDAWRDGPKVYDEYALADVRVLLGLTMIPPRRTIVDRVRRNLEHDLMKSPQNNVLKTIVSGMEKAKPFQKIFDPFDMSCQIKFCYQFCKICHTTEHDFDDCFKNPHCNPEDLWIIQYKIARSLTFNYRRDAEYKELFESLVEEEVKPEVVLNHRSKPWKARRYRRRYQEFASW